MKNRISGGRAGREGYMVEGTVRTEARRQVIRDAKYGGTQGEGRPGAEIAN